MTGTSDEVLMWLTEHSEFAPLLQMSRQRLVGLRKHLRCGEVSEQKKDEILERLKNRMAALETSPLRTITAPKGPPPFFTFSTASSIACRIKSSFFITDPFLLNN